MANPAPGFRKHPDYRIELRPEPREVTIRVAGETLVTTRGAVHLLEQRHAPVLYVPLADMNTAVMRETEHSTYCPFKGYARYWTIRTDAAELENAIWNYPEPYDEMLEIAAYASMYMDRMDQLLIDGAPAERIKPGWTD